MLAFYFVPLVLGENNPARTQVIFPAVVNTKPVEPNCDFWESGFSVFNPNPGLVTVTFTAFDSNSVVKETSTVTINGFNFGAAGFKRPVDKGWVKVTSSQPVVVREGMEHIVGLAGCPTPGFPWVIKVISTLHLAPAAATRRQFVKIQFDKNTGTDTGVSIVFPRDVSSAIANGKLIHRWIDGRKVSERNIQIHANGQLIGLVNELLPPESVTFSPSGIIVGSLEITFDTDVFVEAVALDPAHDDKLFAAFSGTY